MQVKDWMTQAVVTTPEAHLDARSRDVDAMVPLGPGDERPGRPHGRPVAFVIDPEASSRLRTRNDLAALGYRVQTCPGPLGGALCPALGGSGSPRCPRLPIDTSLVVMDANSAQTPLPDAYGQWHPTACIRLAHERPIVPA